MKNIIVVGSEGEIGNAVKEIYSSQNLLCLDYNIEKTTHEKNCTCMKFDSTSEKDIEHISKFLNENRISIDGIIYLAGVNTMAGFYDINKLDWHTTMEVNTAGLLFCLKGWYDYFSEKTSIVCIASQNGIVGHEDRIAYGPAKAALIQLVKNLTMDFSKDRTRDIRINSISPTYLLTKKNHHYFSTLPGKKLINRIPYRKLTTPQEVSQVIEFLMSEASIAIRGQNIVMDYGYTIV